jgi:hypothetical protein
MPTKRRLPAHFDSDWWRRDVERASAAARLEAERVRSVLEHEGIPVEQLRPCETEGRDGTRLANCFKIYIPAPIGRFGMVFVASLNPDGQL